MPGRMPGHKLLSNLDCKSMACPPSSRETWLTHVDSRGPRAQKPQGRVEKVRRTLNKSRIRKNWVLPAARTDAGLPTILQNVSICQHTRCRHHAVDDVLANCNDFSVQVVNYCIQSICWLQRKAASRCCTPCFEIVKHLQHCPACWTGPLTAETTSKVLKFPPSQRRRSSGLCLNSTRRSRRRTHSVKEASGRSVGQASEKYSAQRMQLLSHHVNMHENNLDKECHGILQVCWLCCAVFLWTREAESPGRASTTSVTVTPSTKTVEQPMS